MVLKNHTTGDYAIIKLRKTGWLSDMKNFGEVRVYMKTCRMGKGSYYGELANVLLLKIREDIILHPMRALENAQYKLASDEKFRLEEKQRAARKKREMNGESYYPSWFEQKWNHYLQKNEWTFNHQYWHHRESHDWSKCPDIF
ncbi:Oxysterol-binding protein 1 [Galdieria sulphuraria]|nr:Oxysterol-binding protein 1 [Galdieria sulphuraria]